MRIGITEERSKLDELIKDLSDLKQALDDIAPPLASPPLFHVTGEENGLL
ncbi:MAG: hypothetical protein LBP77_03155 [Rickettsiales bacterium]|jgi:hypothetical protein|nr:hypothetical protein [Rickettsiales bacterium]